MASFLAVDNQDASFDNWTTSTFTSTSSHISVSVALSSLCRKPFWKSKHWPNVRTYYVLVLWHNTFLWLLLFQQTPFASVKASVTNHFFHFSEVGFFAPMHASLNKPGNNNDSNNSWLKLSFCRKNWPTLFSWLHAILTLYIVVFIS